MVVATKPPKVSRKNASRDNLQPALSSHDAWAAALALIIMFLVMALALWLAISGNGVPDNSDYWMIMP